jgi:hypothetical protein
MFLIAITEKTVPSDIGAGATCGANTPQKLLDSSRKSAPA